LGFNSEGFGRGEVTPCLRVNVKSMRVFTKDRVTLKAQFLHEKAGTRGKKKVQKGKEGGTAEKRTENHVSPIFLKIGRGEELFVGRIETHYGGEES